MQSQEYHSSFVIHVEERNHLPKWDNAKVLWRGEGKSKLKLIEAAVIECLPNINSKRGDYTIAQFLGRILWRMQGIMPRDYLLGIYMSCCER